MAAIVWFSWSLIKVQTTRVLAGGNQVEGRGRCLGVGVDSCSATV